METRFFERPEGTLAYTDYGGDGQLVLMLPGLGALRSEYRYLAPKLRDVGYHAVTADLRGHGESSVPWTTYDVPSVGNDILELIQHLDSGPAHLIGTSFAGAAVVWAAAERPESTRSLVLINPFARAQKINPIMNALFWLMMHNPWRARLWITYYSSLYPTHKPDDFQDYMNQLAENMRQPGRMDAAAGLSFSSRQPSDERLNRVKAPTLVIMGGKDPDFPDPAAEGRILAERTGGSLEVIEGVGHYPQTEMPEKAAPILLDFLKRSGSQKTDRVVTSQGTEKKAPAREGAEQRPRDVSSLTPKHAPGD
jgi:pimeloyl-ACP methyl ester carboxylesterase